MKEILYLLKALDFHGLLIRTTNNSLLQFFRYAFIGGIAALIDWTVLYILVMKNVHYLLSSSLGFLAGLFINFCLSKQFVFRGTLAKLNIIGELVGYGIIGLIGLGLTLILMYVLTDILSLYFMISKIFTTLIVLIWNYLARKKSLYT